MRPEGGPKLEEPIAKAEARARELYKYFLPPTAAAEAGAHPAPYSAQGQPDQTNAILTAYSQLVAWRLNCRRAMVSLLDKDTQYFIAESSKTLNLEDSSRSDDPEDALWAGCISVPKAGRLCEHTLESIPIDPDLPAYFEVTDLTKDSRFNTLDFVSGPPHFRYYCGVPLRTKKGIAIGSFFALDDKIRAPIARAQVAFLHTMAQNCINHLESVKEKEDLKRVKNMNMCLAAFVDPENRTRTRRKRRDSSGSIPDDDIHSQSAKSVSTKAAESPTSGYSQPATSSHRGKEPSRVPRKKPDDDGTSITIKNSVDLLFKSLSLNSSSGIVFFDTGTSLNNLAHYKSHSEESSDDDMDSLAKSRHSSSGETTHISYKSWTGSSSKHDIQGENRSSEVLASSYHQNEAPFSMNSHFTPISQFDLGRLIKRYPRGMLWNIEEDSFNQSSSSSDEQAYQMPDSSESAVTLADTQILRFHFPTARQVMFVPFWVPSWSRSAVFLSYNASPYRSFEKNPDFLHCIAFCHCITTELARLATSAADQQKSDFIGSVSHELRSPLHGILASCEFLDDTILSTFQKSLVDTADACARTLLDTINMVLDYSKINAFERSITKVKRSKHQRNVLSSAHLQPSLNIYGDVDLAAITEEVVEGVATGQIYKDRLGDVDSVGISTPNNDVSSDAEKLKSESPDVEIILDVAPRNWIFLTQPGAFRRVVMNLFGNAMKYTTRGYIQVKLDAHRAPKEDDETEYIEIITLIVRDTGQGISPQYMKTKLFTPFAQESSLAPGTGLGLSLVRSIVIMLNGEIDIQSTVGVGTTATVKFPMVCSKASGPTTLSTPASSASIERSKDDSLNVIQALAKERKACFFISPEADTNEEASKLISEVLTFYLSKWYGFTVSAFTPEKDYFDIILVPQTNLSALLSTLKTTKFNPTIVVICSPSSWSKKDTNVVSNYTVESISYPFGPYKLAKILCLCLKNRERFATSSNPATEQSNLAKSIRERENLPTVLQAVEQLKLGPDVHVVQQGQMMANEGFAPLMVEAMSAQSTRSIEQGNSFPFPPLDGLGPTTSGNIQREESLDSCERSPSIALKGPARLYEDAGFPFTSVAPTSSTSAGPSIPILSSNSSTPSTGSRRVLLVDDNTVNLRLLNASMLKRGYKDIHLATDGAKAVAAYNSLLENSTPPDIIFMDISMPVMNGFEATRAIREREEAYRASLGPYSTPPKVMIIALTGLASGRDKTEAFTSGFDLYLVKPISFKSVAKLLDAWEKNGGCSAVPGVPHGPISEENISLPDVDLSQSKAGAVAPVGRDAGEEEMAKTDDKILEEALSKP